VKPIDVDLAIAFICCQMADVVTWAVMDPAREMNPVVLALGPSLALLGKTCLVMGTTYIALTWPSLAMRAVLAFGALIGLFGAWSNL
jgi:predicted PP-loop superfamily ATPase